MKSKTTTDNRFKVIESHRKTELIAKRRAIEEAFRYWDEDEKQFFAMLKISYITSEASPKKIEEQVVIRREVVSHFLKVESLWYWRKDENNSLRLHRDEYLGLWELLKKNQPVK